MGSRLTRTSSRGRAQTMRPHLILDWWNGGYKSRLKETLALMRDPAHRGAAAPIPCSVARGRDRGGGMAITLDTAQAMIERARAHATSLTVPMNIAVTDGGG